MTDRITRLRIENFRSIRGIIDVNLDAPVVLIHGPNGSGKTSVLSAIEMALTKQVSSFERAGARPQIDLIHRNEQQAAIEIERSAAEGADRAVGKVQITSSGVTGTPLLKDLQARFFSERCFLPQSALGRLLEFYEDDARDSSSPLTRFVQELLGLGQLDNLVDGLDHLRDLRPLKRAVPELDEADKLRKSLAAEIADLETEQTAAASQEAEAKEALDELVSDVQLDPSSSVDDLVTALDNSKTYLAEGRRLSILIREIEAALNVIEGIPDSQSPDALNGALLDLRAQDQSLEAWAVRSKPLISRTLEAASKLLKNLPSFESVGYLAAHQAATNGIANELKRLRAISERDQLNQSRLASATEAAEKADARASGLEEQLAGLAQSSGKLAAVLTELVPLIQTDVCPVCDRDFSEHSTVPLSAHIAEHISQLGQTARRMQEVVAERASALRIRDTARTEIANLAPQILSGTVVSEHRARTAQCEEIQEQLSACLEEATLGDTLVGHHRAASAAVAKQRQNEQATAGVRQIAEALPAQIDLEPAKETETAKEILDRCLHAVRERLGVLDKRRELQRRALEAAQTLKSRQMTLERASQAVKECKVRKGVVDLAWANADRTRKAGRLLADHALEARTSIVRRVFNGSLNSVWRDLFIRLAPEEQFIPAFALPSKSGGPIEARLQTLYRGTDEAGNPRAMLSAGNLNTAALTLFLSLHLSVRPVLPWLVIDDPVQSMDEIHIAQFAALLRTLSRQANRQTVIAVHEKSLFDYLALELSPAHENDRLVTLELSRNADGATSYEYDMKTWKRESVLQFVRAS